MFGELKTVTLVLLSFAAFSAAVCLFGSVTRRSRRWRKLRCAFGFHALAPLSMVTEYGKITEHGQLATHHVFEQRCDYCDRRIRLYNRDQTGLLRRVK